MDETKQRIDELVDTLNKWQEAYDNSSPLVSDKQYDDLYFELIGLENKSGYIRKDSPTMKVVWKAKDGLQKVEHSHPMLSLDKTKEISDIKNFVQGHCWIAMAKMDGLTCSLTYENGKLIRAETRGNGFVGEDITHNAMILNNIPKTIKVKERLVVDGEVICDLGTFLDFQEDYATARNFAAGSIRLLDPKECAKRKLKFIAWDLIEGGPYGVLSDNLMYLLSLGFEIVPFNSSEVEPANAITKIIVGCNACNYPIDGIVFKYNQIDDYINQGRTAHHFLGGLAYKFYDEEYETRLRYIDYDVSRNGVLTPVAVFDPVVIDGTSCTRASLHNMSVMEEVLGETPYRGEKIWIYKANQIIPQVSQAEPLDYGTIIRLGGVTTGLGGDYGILCPICGGMTSIKVSDAGVKVLYCDNDQCEGKLAQQIDHFCGKKGLDIKGLSRKTIEKLIDWGWVNSIKDIFYLHNHQIKWMNQEGFGKASVCKILDAIDEARENVDLASFIAAMGIPLIGTTAAKSIATQFKSWDKFVQGIEDRFDFNCLFNFGPEMSKSLLNFDYTEMKEIAQLLKFKDVIESDNEKIYDGLTFCVTGKLTHWKNRDELKAYITDRGGKVTDSVSAKTNYLINNDINSTSAKNKKAKELNIPILTEGDFLKLYE